MRLIVLLISLLIVGLLTYRQVSPGASHGVEEPDEDTSSHAPKVPVRPQDEQKFGQDMTRFMDDAAKEQAKKIDQSLQ